MIDHDQERARRLLVENPDVTRALFRVSSRVCVGGYGEVSRYKISFFYVGRRKFHAYYKW
jgi:hypothetical protein